MFKRRKLGKSGSRPTSTEALLASSNTIIECTGSEETHSLSVTDTSASSDPPTTPAQTKALTGTDGRISPPGNLGKKPIPVREPVIESGLDAESSKVSKIDPGQPKQVAKNPPDQRSQARKGTSIVYDLQPNICKEYHKTGYCSYGDTCKFAHIRDLHPAKTPASKPKEEAVNRCCQICYKDPVQPASAKCGHRFCLQCFLSAKPKKCPECNAETNGSISIER